MIVLIKSVNSTVLNVIRDTVQSNIAGLPIAHQISTFEFDPDVSIKRRPQYYEVNSIKI